MTEFIVITAIAIIIIGLSKGGLGGTIGVLATPLMTLVLPAPEAVGLLLPLLLLADVFAIIAHWRRWDNDIARLLLIGAVFGIVLGSLLISYISAEFLRVMIGVVTLIFVLYKLTTPWFTQTLKFSPQPWHGVVAGAVGGFTSTLAHTGGPPVVIYLLLLGMPALPFAATSAFVFTIINILKLPSYLYLDLIDFGRLLQVLWLIPLLPLSVWLGRIFAKYVKQSIFEGVLVAILGVTAYLLLFG